MEGGKPTGSENRAKSPFGGKQREQSELQRVEQGTLQQGKIGGVHIHANLSEGEAGEGVLLPITE